MPKSGAFGQINNYYDNVNFTEVHIEDLAAWCSMDLDNSSSSPMYGNSYTNIRKLYLNNEEITNLDALSGATEIKNFAFWANFGLTKINIPESVNKIGKSAFVGCGNVTEVSIPNSIVDVVWYENFYGFAKLQSINVSDSHPTLKTVDGALYTKDGETLVKWPSGKNDNGHLTLPNGIKKIGGFALFGNYRITSLEIPEGVEEIEQSAIVECPQMTSLSLPKSLSKVGFQAFYSNYQLKSLYIKDLSSWCNIEYDYMGRSDGSLYYGNDILFSNRYDLYVNDVKVTDLVIPQNVSAIPSCLFTNANIASVKFHSNVLSVGYNAFYSCPLVAVNIEDIPAWCNIDFESEYSNPLRKAGNLYLDGTLVTDLVIPNNITEIKNNTFSNAQCLTSVIFPSSLTSIGDYAFYNVKAIQSLSLPNVISVGDFAFFNCTNIETIDLPEVKIIGTSAFSKSYDFYSLEHNLTMVSIPKVEELGAAAFSECKKLQSIEIPKVKTIKRDTFYNCKNLQSVDLPKVETIGSSAFYYCKNLQSVDLPKVETIEYNAFSDCNNLQSIELPKSLCKIDYYAFYGCNALSSINLPYKLQEIGYGAFYRCENLSTVYNASKLQLQTGSEDNGYVAYYATNIITIAPDIRIYNGSSDFIVAGDLEEAESYATAENALVFAEIVDEDLPVNYVVDGHAKEITISDAKPFYSPSEITAESITYTRTFSNTNWQSLYIPYNLSYDDWCDKACIAELAGVHTYEDSPTIIEFITVKSGDLLPNTPYVIRALSASSEPLTFTSTNKNLSASPDEETRFISCSSPRWTYKLFGNYQPLPIERVEALQAKVLGGGKLMYSSTAVKPMRFYLVKEKSNNGYWGAPALSPDQEEILVMIDGVLLSTEETNSILSSFADCEDGVTYNLQGVKVNSNNKGFVIKNGKKLFQK